MACTRPMLALDLGVINGKRKIKILPKRFDRYSKEALSQIVDSSKLLYLPCGQCISCKIAKSKEWAVRCVLEAKCHLNNYFLTITYDNEHYPEGLNKKELTNFLKSLQREFNGLRYFACGEYGSKSGRPHYHAILFNANINDLKCIGKTDYGYYYESKTLNKLWSRGHLMLADFSYHTAAYIARYTLKKIFVNSNNDEFLVMSLKPGIGATYFYTHYKAIYSEDLIYGKFGNSLKARPPRYFDKLLERIDLDLFDKIKNQRLDSSKLDHIDKLISHNLTHFEDLYLLKDKTNLHKYKKLVGRRL